MSREHITHYSGYRILWLSSCDKYRILWLLCRPWFSWLRLFYQSRTFIGRERKCKREGAAKQHGSAPPTSPTVSEISLGDHATNWDNIKHSEKSGIRSRECVNFNLWGQAEQQKNLLSHPCPIHFNWLTLWLKLYMYNKWLYISSPGRSAIYVHKGVQ